MHSEDKFGLWLSIMHTIQCWESGDAAYKIHLYDGAPDERKIGNMVTKLCQGLEPMMTTRRLPLRALKRKTVLKKHAKVRSAASKRKKVR
jgi:hypothetical protein